MLEMLSNTHSLKLTVQSMDDQNGFSEWKTVLLATCRNTGETVRSVKYSDHSMVEGTGRVVRDVFVKIHGVSRAAEVIEAIL